MSFLFDFSFAIIYISIMKPIPLEEQHPDIADLFMDIANGRYEYGVKSIKSGDNDDSIFTFMPVINTVTIGRNDPCSCGSGKKYKKCCG